jgi:diguanylate cyclase (GGDEF)-like protein/PAS domain S-box-containing protein
MKLSKKKKFRPKIVLVPMLLAVAGAGMYLSFSSFLAAVGPQWRADDNIRLFVTRLVALFAVCLLVVAVAVLALFSLLRREAILRRRTETMLSRFMQTAETSADLITIMTRKGRIEYVNQTVERTTGYPRKDLIGKRHTPRLPWHADADLARQIQNALRSGAPFQGVAGCRRKDGGPFIIQERIEPFRDSSGAVTRMISTAEDISREKRMQDRLDYLDRYDPLTGVPNRHFLVEKLEQALTKAREGSGSLSVLIIDIDRFKHVNNLFGSAVGDAVLKRVSERVRAAVHERDIVARLGNNEFAVIHFDEERQSDATSLAENIRSAVSRDFTVDGNDIVVTVTIGISVYPENGGDAWTLIRNADLALAKAKALGRNTIQCFDEGITKRIAEFFILEKSLFSALRNNEYSVHYQPYCDLATREVSGAEALIKWKNPDLGVVSPSKFIPSLEDTGMIIDVGRWVLETACGQIKAWERKKRVFPVSVNLSLVQFRHQYLVGMVSDAISSFQLDPRNLTLEVTETVFIHDMEFAIRVLKRLKDVGVSLSVDDFGTGYSSLSYIKRLPVDNLKIDMSFVRDVTRDPDAASIITAITTLARSLNLKTIAEGVETEEQRNILHLLRCDMGQGYLFSPAVPAEEFDKMLGEGKEKPATQ